jgi:Ca2+-binding EF-hand superfamily protein
MKTILRSKAFVTVLLGVAAATAGAEPPSRPRIDTNADGIVDFQELQAVNPDLTLDEFNRIDTNSDGQLVSEELATAFTAKMMKRLDADGDGAVTREEMENAGPPRRDPAERFQEFDADGDGKLNESEFTAMHEAMRKQFGGMHKHPGRRGPQTE